MRKVIGILGGMGPEATVDLFAKIVRATPARRDQEHLRIIIDNNPQIPDRTAAILGQGEDPVPVLVATAQNLERAGAELLVIPCNTAHYFHGQIAAAVRIPVLHMIKETARAIREAFPSLAAVGLLATTGTIKTGLYRTVLAAAGIAVLTPPPELQAAVMEAIYGPEGIKAGRREGPAAAVRRAAEALIAAGAEGIVCGCTELPLVLGEGDLPLPVLDPTRLLAEAAVREAFGHN